MTIGERIKHYRLRNQMTQEKLAAELNISFQAVSKWERNESLPDVTLIARLAEILNVTCDALLTENSCFTESEIDEIIREASALGIGVHESYSQRIDLLEKALEKYPHSIRLMLELADSYSKGSAYPEYKEKNYLQKTVDIEEYVAAHTTDPVQKYQTTTMLCYMYRALEKYDRIRELAETMPELYQTKPALIHHAMPGAEQLEGIHSFCKELIDMTECYLNLLIYPNMGETEKEALNHLREIADDRNLWNTKRYE